MQKREAVIGVKVQLIPDSKTYTVKSEVNYDNTVTIYDESEKKTQRVNVNQIQKIEDRIAFPSIEQLNEVTKPDWLYRALSLIDKEAVRYDIAKEAYESGLDLQWTLKSLLEPVGYYILVSGLWQKTTKEAFDGFDLPKAKINMEYLEESLMMLKIATDLDEAIIEVEKYLEK